jgi:Yip1-like protein
MATFVERVVRAAKLDVTLYEEVENDTTATGQALGVVLISSVAAGIGSGTGMRGLVVGTIAGLVGWAFWAWITHLIGTRLLNEPGTSADWGQVARAIGFAQAPGILRIVGIIPFLANLTFLITAIWILVAVVIAVRQALDFTSTLRAVAVCFIGWLVQLVFFWMVAGLLR